MNFDSSTAMERVLARRNIHLTDSAGFHLCLAGERTILLNSRPYTLRRGSLYVQSPIVVGEVVSDTPDYEEVSCRERLEVLFPIFRRVSSVLAQLDIPHHPCIHLVEEEMEDFLQHCARHRQLREQVLTTESPMQRALLEGMAALHVQTLMLDTLRRFALRLEVASRTPLEQGQHTVASRFLVLLNLHFKRERSVQFYAAELGFSTGHFTALIKAQTGQPPSAWIATVTMTQARALLLNTRRSIKEIAAELGFPEQFTFRKYFKLHAGVSPKEFRRSQAAPSQKEE